MTLVVVFVLALGARTVAAARVALIERDGIEYLASAGKLARGDLRGALAHYYPPAFPAVVVALAPLVGGAPLESASGERAGQAAAALAGALAAVAAALAAALAFGHRSGWFAGIVAAVHPSCVEQSAKVTADSLFTALVLGAVAATVASFAGGRRPRVLLALAGALAAASYLARPEGIVVLAALAAAVALVRRSTPGPSRAGAPAWVLLPGLLVGLGYVVAIKPDAAMTGRDAGVWKLTKKRELFLEAGGARAFPRSADGSRHLDVAGAGEVVAGALGRGAKQAWLTLVEGNLALVLALLGALGLARARARSREPDPRRALALATAASGGGLAFAYALIRTDPRYGAILFALALPFAGHGLALAHGRLGRVSPRAGRVLIALFLLAHLAVATRPRLERKVTWRLAGERCHELGLDPVASVDPRVAFYASATLVDIAPRPETTRDPEARAREILEKARAGGAKAIIVGGTHPEELAVIGVLKKTLGNPTRIEQDAAETVISFPLQ